MYTEVTGQEAYVGCSPWGTDGGLLNQLAGTPSVVLGPGVTKMAHFPNEFIYLDDVFKVLPYFLFLFEVRRRSLNLSWQQCAEIYAYAIAEWCGVVA